jgi:hypothetical protein
MKTALSVICFMAMLGTVVFAQEPAKPPKNTKPSFKMTISSENQNVIAGSKVIVTVHLTNVSDLPLNFPSLGFGKSGPDPSYRADVRKSDGQLAPYTV